MWKKESKKHPKTKTGRQNKSQENPEKRALANRAARPVPLLVACAADYTPLLLRALSVGAERALVRHDTSSRGEYVCIMYYRHIESIFLL